MPFNRFRTTDGAWVDTLLGPEMKSTGEVMGIDVTFGVAFAKSQTASYGDVPTEGTVFVSVANRDKRHVIFPVKRLADLGFKVVRHRRNRGGTAPQRGRRDRAPQGDQGPGEDGTRPSSRPSWTARSSLIINTPLRVSEGRRPASRRLARSASRQSCATCRA